MSGRAFYRRKRFWLGLLVLAVLVILGGSVMWVPSRSKMNAQRRAVSPDGEFVAFALPVGEGDTRGPRGGLMVYLRENSEVIDRRATSLQGTWVTRLTWNDGVEPRSFRIWDEKGTRMVWQVEGKRMVCVEGREFLVGEERDGDE